MTRHILRTLQMQLSRPLLRAYSSTAHLTHVDSNAKAQMVDVSDKPNTKRTAEAQATVMLGPEAFRQVKENTNKKGDVLTVAKLAGISAAKQTSSLIPLCHPLALSHCQVTLALNDRDSTVFIHSSATTTGPTGVEMEALTAASIAALTVYDMCKAVSKDIVISNIALVSKTGGKSGDYRSVIL